MTDRERYQRTKEIFNEALALEGQEREEYLLRTCSGDELLLKEIRGLLADDERANSSWEQAVKAHVVEQFAAYQGDTALPQPVKRPLFFWVVLSLGTTVLGFYLFAALMFFQYGT